MWACIDHGQVQDRNYCLLIYYLFMWVGFSAGALYGAVSVCVGQPLDTIKTITQTSSVSVKQSIKNVWKRDGLKGFYR